MIEDSDVRSRQLGIEMRDYKKNKPWMFSHFFQTGDLNSIRMPPTKASSEDIDSVFHKYPRFSSWNKNRISEVKS